MTLKDKEPPLSPPLFDLPPQEESPPAKKEPAIFEEFSWYWSLASRGKFNRRVVLGLTASLLGGLGLLLSRGFKGLALAQAKDNRVATALFAEGILTVTRADGSIKRLAGQGSLPLFEGDKLQTGRVSQGYLIFRDGSRMALNANTTLVIRSRKDDKGTVQVIKLTIGEIWSLIAKKTKRFEVETPNALAAVSGTEFGVNVVTGSIISSLTVGEGEMDFGSRGGDEPTMDDIPPNRRRRVGAGFQSNIRDRDLPTDPALVNVDRILNWGRSLNARFGPRGIGIEESGDHQPRGLPRFREYKPSEPSSYRFYGGG